VEVRGGVGGYFLKMETENCSVEMDGREAWLKASEQALMRVWDNPVDEVYNELLRETKDGEWERRGI
jgi:hypothetical protein